MLVEPGGGVDAGLRVAIESIEQRMAVSVVVRRKLRLNIRQRDVAADAHVHSLGHVRKI